MNSSSPVVSGAAIVYRLSDVGYDIALDDALALLSAQGAVRIRPSRGEAQAIQISNPPITIVLETATVSLEGVATTIEISARIFDFGVVSMRARIPTAGTLTWEAFAAFGNEIERTAAVRERLDAALAGLVTRISAVVRRPAIAPVTEDYIVYRVVTLRAPDGRPLSADALGDVDVVPLLLNESRQLSVAARRELLPHRFSYYADDLAILTWDNALVIDPSDGDTDVQFVLEFANAQLLELRYYDAMLDEELPRMYDRIESARAHPSLLLSRRYAPLLAALQERVADSTELVERVENALKVTDDVYLARVYASALEIFRASAWRAGIDRKLRIVQDTYAMLNSEAQAARGELLEISIVVLIVAEFLLALFRR
jgi:hypothetical protein